MLALSSSGIKVFLQDFVRPAKAHHIVLAEHVCRGDDLVAASQDVMQQVGALANAGKVPDLTMSEIVKEFSLGLNFRT